MARLTDDNKNPITADGNTKIANVNQAQMFSLQVTGTFGGGTINVSLSTDGGNTLTDLEDASGVIAITENKVINIELAGDLSKPPVLYLKLTGATNPSITYNLYTDVRS